MYPILKNASNTTLAVLNNPISLVINEGLDLSWTLSGTFIKDSKMSLVAKTTKIEVDGQYFNVIYKEDVEKDANKTVLVRCEHCSYDANNYTLETFAFTGTAEEILTELLSQMGASDFTVGTIATTGEGVLLFNELTSLRYAVSLLANLFSIEVQYDNKTINMPTQVGADNGEIFKATKDLQGIRYIENYLTDETSIVVDVLTLSETEEFKQGKFNFPQIVSLGDTVTVETATLNKNTRVVAKSYNPLKRFDTVYTLSTKLDDYTSQATKEKLSLLIKGRSTYGVDINGTDGLTIAEVDGNSQLILNSTVLSWKVKVLGELVDRLYFDVIAGDLKYNGLFDVDAINAIRAEIDVIVNNTFVTNNLYAQFGRIADLTVSSLDTSWLKIINYLKGDDVSDVLYQRIYEDRIEKWVAVASTNGNPTDFTATVISYNAITLDWTNPLGSSEEQYTDIYGTPLYWIENPFPYTGQSIGMTTETTSWPVMVYVYDEFLKEVSSIELIDGVYTPVTQYGVGTGVNDNGKAFMYKKSDGIYIDYYKATDGSLVRFALTDNGPLGLIPSGGTTGQVLAKLSNDDYDVGWVTP